MVRDVLSVVLLFWLVGWRGGSLESWPATLTQPCIQSCRKALENTVWLHITEQWQMSKNFFFFVRTGSWKRLNLLSSRRKNVSEAWKSIYQRKKKTEWQMSFILRVSKAVQWFKELYNNSTSPHNGAYLTAWTQEAANIKQENYIISQKINKMCAFWILN